MRQLLYHRLQISKKNQERFLRPKTIQTLLPQTTKQNAFRGVLNCNSNHDPDILTTINDKGKGRLHWSGSSCVQHPMHILLQCKLYAMFTHVNGVFSITYHDRTFHACTTILYCVNIKARDDITEILLKVALNTITLTH